jgi:hypothetical protein
MRHVAGVYPVGVAVVMSVVAASPAARGGGPLGISEIRLASAEESLEPSASEPSIMQVVGVEEDAESEASPSDQTSAAPESQARTAERTPTKPQPATIRPQFRRGGTSPGTFARAQAEPKVANNQIRQALNFYGGSQARATLSQFPLRTPIQAAPERPIGKQVKPFNTVYRDPTISPYMNLYRDERDPESALNYFTMVRPQIDQIDTNRAQQLEIQKLERQVQGRSRGGPPQRPAAAASSRSTPARYMDTAQFYGSWAR